MTVVGKPTDDVARRVLLVGIDQNRKRHAVRPRKRARPSQPIRPGRYRARPSPPRSVAIEGSSAAFLLYTAGTTSPKSSSARSIRDAPPSESVPPPTRGTRSSPPARRQHRRAAAAVDPPGRPAARIASAQKRADGGGGEQRWARPLANAELRLAVTRIVTSSEPGWTISYCWLPTNARSGLVGHGPMGGCSR